MCYVFIHWTSSSFLTETVLFLLSRPCAERAVPEIGVGFNNVEALLYLTGRTRLLAVTLVFLGLLAGIDGEKKRENDDCCRLKEKAQRLYSPAVTNLTLGLQLRTSLSGINAMATLFSRKKRKVP